MSPVPVGLSPPPAQIEYIEPLPGGTPEGCAWLDGVWQWSGKDWRWVPGSWVEPAPDCYYAAPALVWVPAGGEGALYHVPGRWYARAAPRNCTAPAPCDSPSASHTRR